MSSLSRREEFAKAAMQSLIIVYGYAFTENRDLGTLTYQARLIADDQLKQLRENPSEYKTPKCDTGPG